MQIQFIILMQLLGLICLFIGYGKKSAIFTAFGAILFGILAFGYYNVEETLLVSNNATIIETSNTTNTINYNYEVLTKQYKEMPMVALNIGLMGLAMLIFYSDTFGNGFRPGE